MHMLSEASAAVLFALLMASQTLASPTSAPASYLSLAYPVLADVESAKYTYDINATLPKSELNLRKRTCSRYNAVAFRTARAMQGFYYNVTGHYDGGEAWTDVNAVEDLLNLMLYDDSTEFDDIPEAVFTYWDSYFKTAGEYEDVQWATLASFKQCDYLAANGRDTSECLTRALTYYNFAVYNSAWDAVCGGGVWSSSAKTYKNTITTELFLYTSASGYARTGQPGLLSNAKLAWNWLNSTDLRNPQGLYNDGLDTSTCINNGETVWTYNQMVIAAGLASLYDATGDESYLTLAQVSIDAAIYNLENHGILKESCDSMRGDTTCTSDEQMFKGIFMKHLQYFLDMVNDSTITAKYATFIQSQGSAVVRYATGPGYRVGSVWYGREVNVWGSRFTPQAQTSGLAALNAATKFAAGGPC